MINLRKLILSCMICIVSLSTVAFAAETDDGDLSYEEGAQEYEESLEDYLLRTRKESQLFENYGISLASSSSQYTILNVPVFVQENGYYCGPATVKQVVHFIMGSSNSQTYYANRLGTTTSGTDMTRIAGVINTAIGDNYYVYDPIDSRAEWERELSKSLVDLHPAILDINTNNVSGIPYNTSGHFVCLSGEDAITTDGDGYFFRIADPHTIYHGNKWYTKDDLYTANINHFRQAYIW